MRDVSSPLEILLLCSAFNGLSQRAWIELSSAGHHVSVRLAGRPDAMSATVTAVDPDLVICPFLRERVPSDVWERYRTIIVHPGPVGDRGPSSLDWAIVDGESRWGVTALQAVEEMDAGPIWAERTFDVPADVRKSSLYNEAVADAAIAVINEVVAKAIDPAFSPTPLDHVDRVGDVAGRSRPSMMQRDRAFSWAESTRDIIRRIRSADGSPGVHTELCGVPVSVFDAAEGPVVSGKVGVAAVRHNGAVLVPAGDGSVWIGHVRRLDAADGSAVKLPAALALGDLIDEVPEVEEPLVPCRAGPSEISYRRLGDVGILTFDFYNGAMSTSQCRRLVVAVQRAMAQSTRVLVIGGGESFSNGIHLNVIEAAPDPAAEAWRNINAINDVCRQIITCTTQIVVSSVRGNAGAGGVMMALGADRVVVRDGVVVNPHYRTMGLFGSEYWTYVLPRRVGHEPAAALTRDCLPVGSHEAVSIGLADRVLPRDRADYDDAVIDEAMRLATGTGYDAVLAAKQRARAESERRRPLETYRIQELAEMSRDIFDDRHGFATLRRAFVHKHGPSSTPAHLLELPATVGHRSAGVGTAVTRRTSDGVGVRGERATLDDDSQLFRQLHPIDHSPHRSRT